MTMTENIQLYYMQLLTNYHDNVYTTRKCKTTLAKLHVNGQISDGEYISYIPRMEAKLEVLAELLQRNYQEDLKTFKRL
nr:MAG TPA: hypothetical protein [Bacteriophage sp.]